MPSVDDEYVSARDVMSNEQRLAFDGYQLIDSDSDKMLGLTIQLMDGQRQISKWPNVFQAVKNRPGETAKQLYRPVLQAVVHFLNAGGDPLEIADLAQTVESMPMLRHNGFTLVGVHDDVARDVYYVTDDKRVIRVTPGLISEEVPEDELEIIDDEEDSDEAVTY